MVIKQKQVNILQTASLEGAKARNYKLPDVNTKDYSIEKRVISIKVDDKEMTAGEQCLNLL